MYAHVVCLSGIRTHDNGPRYKDVPSKYDALHHVAMYVHNGAGLASPNEFHIEPHNLATVVTLPECGSLQLISIKR